MERGELAVDGRLATVFVFEDLLAHVTLPKVERRLVKKMHWDGALQMWVFNYKVVDYAYSLMSRYDIPVEVITWHPHGFAQALQDRLYDMDLPVRDVIAGDYLRLSPVIAIDPQISTVHDPAPEHRFGYGFKNRELPF